MHSQVLEPGDGPEGIRPRAPHPYFTIIVFYFTNIIFLDEMS